MKNRQHKTAYSHGFHNKTSFTSRKISFDISSILIWALVSILLISTLCLSLTQVSAETYEITLNEVCDQVKLHTDTQSNYLADSIQNATSYAKGTSEKSKPQSITLSWTVSKSPSSPTYTVKLSKSQSLSPCETYTTTNTSQEVINLEIGRTYYWQVSFKQDNKTYTSKISSFTTERTCPRFINIDGVTNVRDLGGYTTCDGKVVKQGRIYRCGKLNSNYSTDIIITKSGIEEFVNHLNIKSEIDIREAGEAGYITSSPLGSSVTYKNFPMDWTDYLMDKNKSTVKNFFEYLADDKNYPVAFHCAIGTDRTGFLSYLLEGLLGVSETEMIRDYLISNFGNISGSRSINWINDDYPKTIHNYAGATLQEKVYNFINEYFGVSKANLDKIIELNTEEPENSDNYLTISSAQQFYSMQPGKKYRLTDDISINSSYGECFNGVLDGGDHTITTSSPVFSELTGVVQNLSIDGNVQVSGAGGGLAANIKGALIVNVTNEADITATTNAGGLVGESSATSMFIGCSNKGNVIGATVGGEIGYSTGALTLSKCESYGTITSNSTTGYGGGLVGKCSGSALIQNCSNFGSVSCIGPYAGGIVGYMNTQEVFETFISCHNKGNVTYTANSGDSNLAGIVGHVYGGSYYDTISNCSNHADLISKSTGNVTLAGLCSYVDTKSIAVNNCSVSGLMSAKNTSAYGYHTLFYDVSTITDNSVIANNEIDNVTYNNSSANDIGYKISDSRILYRHFQRDSISDMNIILAAYKDTKMIGADNNTVGANQLLLLSVPRTDIDLAAKIFFVSPNGCYLIKDVVEFTA